MARSPFLSWNGVDPWQIYPGVHLHAAGGERVLLCRVTYAPGTDVARHTHEASEQLMVITDGSVEVTIGTETRKLEAGDACVITRGIEHELHSAEGATFFEALSPVPLDHVPDRDRDLVLGADGDTLHVAR
ncbi:MAG TPA: cupin domain-containing protein [Actinomycetota bacterium]